MFGIIETNTFFKKVNGVNVQLHSTQRCIVGNELPEDKWTAKDRYTQYKLESYTPEQIALIVAAQEQQLAKPTKAVVNCEGSFVKDTIQKTDYPLSQIYWTFVCSFRGDENSINDMKFGKEVFDNQVALHAIDKTVTMPSWGYAGT